LYQILEIFADNFVTIGFCELKKNKIVKKGHFEIVSLVGTLDPDGQHHLHISISDANGNVFGGHVLSDHIVYTTGKMTTQKITVNIRYILG